MHRHDVALYQLFKFGSRLEVLHGELQIRTAEPAKIGNVGTPGLRVPDVTPIGGDIYAIRRSYVRHKAELRTPIGGKSTWIATEHHPASLCRKYSGMMLLERRRLHEFEVVGHFPGLFDDLLALLLQ